ncbi:MAG TPA: FAD-dependent oxidoreductase, partial [Planctomycetota bacterium]|nr:FAD-dependent oxidoreductase [Planctomycetota bacterium]
MHPDLLIVGGGAIGLALADCALRNGLSVTVLERGEPGREASWAGAGMLTCRPRPRATHGGPDYHDLTCMSVKLHAQWAARLTEETGIDTGYRVCGALELIRAEPSPDHDYAGCTGDTETSSEILANIESLIRGCNSRGVPARRIDASEALRLEPELTPEIIGAIEFPEEAQIRNPWFLRALNASVTRKGGVIRSGVTVADIVVDGSRVTGLRLANGEIVSAGRVAVCSGAWAAQLPALVKAAPRCGKIAPVRGQILCFQTDPTFARRLISDGNHYIVPRGDGIILVGATHEHAGFEKTVTSEGIAELLAFTRQT